MKNESKYNFKEKALIYALAIGVGIILSFVSVFILALISLFLDLGDAVSAPFAAISLAVGSFASSYLSSKKFKKGGIYNGLICASITFLLVFFISLIVDKGGITLNTLFNLIAVFLSALIGGISGTGQKKYSKY